MKNFNNRIALMLPCFILAMNINATLAQTTINLPAAQNCAPAGAADTDSDGLPDSRDACPSVAGVWALKGCPVPAGTSGQAYKWMCDHAGTAIVDVTLPDGSVWMDRNLGALRAATDEIDLLAAGCLYQYGRKPDGHEATAFYQPKNWLNGYPTADNVLASGSTYIGEPTYNGYSIYPSVGNYPNPSTPFAANALWESAVFNYQTGRWPSNTPSYNQLLNDPGNVVLNTPLDVESPGIRHNTYNGYTPSLAENEIVHGYWWNTSNPLFPNTYFPKLWGGTEWTGADETTTTLSQAWGQEKNPVCPTGYHVPLAAEWISALNSIINEPYTGQWGKSKLKLVVPFGASIPYNGVPFAYWTSTFNNTGNVLPISVNFYPNNTYGDMDNIAVGNVSISGSAANSTTHPPFAAGLYVRCKKN